MIDALVWVVALHLLFRFIALIDDIYTDDIAIIDFWDFAYLILDAIFTLAEFVLVVGIMTQWIRT